MKRIRSSFSRELPWIVHNVPFTKFDRLNEANIIGRVLAAAQDLSYRFVGLFRKKTAESIVNLVVATPSRPAINKPAQAATESFGPRSCILFSPWLTGTRFETRALHLRPAGIHLVRDTGRQKTESFVEVRFTECLTRQEHEVIDAHRPFRITKTLDVNLHFFGELVPMSLRRQSPGTSFWRLLMQKQCIMFLSHKSPPSQ